MTWWRAGTRGNHLGALVEHFFHEKLFAELDVMLRNINLKFLTRVVFLTSILQFMIEMWVYVAVE